MESSVSITQRVWAMGNPPLAVGFFDDNQFIAEFSALILYDCVILSDFLVL